MGRTYIMPRPHQSSPVPQDPKCPLLLGVSSSQASMDALSFCLSLLGIYGLVLYLRYLLPRYVIPSLSSLLNEIQQLLRHAEVLNAIPPESEYKTQLDRLVNEVVMMRVESNHARGTFQQLRLVVQRGLTCRLYILYYRIEAFKSTLELAIDKQLLTMTQSATTTGTVVASPTAGTRAPCYILLCQGCSRFIIPLASAIPVNNHVVQQILPPPVTAS
ncbi:hypothetical protein BC827DRAFT_596833 [Russula dissimulans]|nr:hypothetical protein BC827DRAFT_596833 [Russula dissimulans]